MNPPRPDDPIPLNGRDLAAPGSAGSRSGRRRDLFVGLLLFCATLAVFSRVLVADFVQWDDDISVYRNPYVQGLSWGRVMWMFSDASYAMRYKPLTWLTYALLYQAVGLKPFGYHLAALLIHGLNVVLVFVVVRRLLAIAASARASGAALAPATLPAACGALLWGLNPLRVEPVARVTDLTYCLLLCGLLISLWAYLRACAGPAGGTERSPFYFCSVAAFALAMLAYPFAFTYGVVLLVLDWYPLRRFEGCGPWWRDARARGILREKVPFLLWGGIVLTTLFTRLNPTGIWVDPEFSHRLGWFERCMQAFYVWGYYLWKPWLPLHLSPVYTTLVNFNANHWPFWLSATVVVGLTVLLLWKRRPWPWALALWACHLALLLPALGLTERPHFTADRYGYLAGLVWAVAVAAALLKLRAQPGLFAAGTAGALAVAACWGGLSLNQTQHWRNSVTLFEYMIRELGDNSYRSKIHWHLGKFYAEQRRPDDAMREYQASLRIQPAFRSHQLLAELQERTGNPQAALTNYLAALQLQADPGVHYAAGLLLCKLGRSGEAIAHYQEALRLAPDELPTLNNLAWILATDNDPQNRRGAEAVRLAERICASTGRQVPAYLGTLAAAYAETGRFKEALETGQAARDRAVAAGETQLAESYRKMLEQYRAGQPYRQPSATPAKRAD